MTPVEREIMFNEIIDWGFLGRNGSYKMIGIHVSYDVLQLRIHPITSKGQIGSCWITISKNSIRQLIETLEEYERALNI